MEEEEEEENAGTEEQPIKNREELKASEITSKLRGERYLNLRSPEPHVIRTGIFVLIFKSPLARKKVKRDLITWQGSPGRTVFSEST